MLIHAYGSFWNPDIVDWGSQGAGHQGKLPGKIRRNGRTYTIDFWNAYGIYVLHDQFKPLYVGKAASTRLGTRVRSHLTDRFAGRWDMFSWFTLSTINVTYSNLRDPGKRYLTESTINSSLEALAILIADPPLNRKRESIPSAVEAKQARNPHPKTVRRYLELILNHLENNAV
jgi:hypothetical protein